jgi:hypothetical protein
MFFANGMIEMTTHHPLNKVLSSVHDWYNQHNNQYTANKTKTVYAIDARQI